MYANDKAQEAPPLEEPTYGVSKDEYSAPESEQQQVPTDETGSQSRGALGPGWDLLAEGNDSAALREFASQAESNPRKGGPKVGYALAAAGLGDLSRGVWAMRRALHYDPQGAHYVPIGDRLRPRVQQVIERYRALGADRTDAAFMLSALHYLQRDLPAARSAIDVARAAGDRHSSTRNLTRLIADEVEAQARAGDGP